MDAYRNQIENEVLEEVVRKCYRMPGNEKEEQSLQVRIKNTYVAHIKEKEEIPCLSDIYSKIWMYDFEILVHIARKVVDDYVEKYLDRQEKVDFYEEESVNYVDYINNICTTINNFMETNGYRIDMKSYIKEYIVGFGYPIYELSPKLSDVKIISGDSQLLLPYNFSWPCVTIGHNMLLNKDVKGGILLA